jgi:prepilin-type N-terminal cleavage/methylation domain-containing protein
MSTKNKKISYIFKSVYPTSYTEPNLIRTENSAFRTSLQEDKLNGMPIPKTKNQKPKTILKTPLAFTLVELIVVIVILAILATIAFLSFSSQSASARDSTRLSDMNNIVK